MKTEHFIYFRYALLDKKHVFQITPGGIADAKDWRPIIF